MQTLLSLRLKPWSPADLLNQSPEKPDQLDALLPEPAQARALAVFLTQALSPATGTRLRNSIAAALILHRPLPRTKKRVRHPVRAAGRPGIGSLDCGDPTSLL